MGEFFNNKPYNKEISKFPIGEILKFSYLNKKPFLWVIFLGIMPLLILYMHSYYNLEFERTAWILGTYFCLIWGFIFNLLIKPDRDLWSTGLFYAVFTALIGVPILIFIQNIPPISLLYEGTKSKIFIFRVIGYVFGVGVLEETCKLLPILLFGTRNKRIFSLKEGLFLGLMSGLGFAVAEAVHYTIMYWQGSAQISLYEAYRGVNDVQKIINSLTAYYGNMVIIQIVRFMTLPLFHAIWTAIASWFVVVATYSYPLNKKIIATGILFMAVVHGFYDIYSGDIKGIGICIATIFIFMGYLSYSEKIESQRLW